MLTNIKKRTALLLSVAVVCATVALVPQTAGASASKVPNAGTATDPQTAPASTTAYSACPGSSAPAAGFTDTTSTDVDCIKMFGITQGTTATTYGPDESIPRWQMALFIHRMFTPTSMTAAGLTAVPAFTDIGDLSADIQAAINALASHSITLGKTATTFAPNDNVTRAEMALFLYRYAQIVGAYDDATPSGVTMSIASGAYNYSDIAGQSFEAMEAIIGLYNAGVTGETCTATTAAVGACATSYRPSDNITRAEMASMLKELLDHTNARPAGATIQPTTASGLAGTIASTISYRNADFTPVVSGIVDEFYQVVDNTSATTEAASVPFNALSGLCNGSTGGVATAGGTLCTLTTADKVTTSKGNVAGTSQVLVANSTGRWWVWTGDQGSQYINGTTSTGFNYDNVVPASATASTFAATSKPSFGTSNAYKCNASGVTNVTANDGLCTRPGEARTITVALASATGAAVADGYTVKFVHKKVDYLGNVTNSTSYVAGGSTNPTYTITCGADNSATTNGAIGAGGAADYFESHEVTVSFGTAAAGTGLPTGAGAPTQTYPDSYGKHNSTMNVTCDDAVRAYTPGTTLDTLSISDNTIAVSAAGSLVSVTATAYDQYGTGVAGKTVQFQSDTQGVTGAAAGAANQAVLTTGADGSATLTSVVCTAGGTVAWNVETDTGDMADIAASAPNAGAVEGTTVHCASAGTDGYYAAATAANQVSVITINETTANIDGGVISICLQNVGGLGDDATAQCSNDIAETRLVIEANEAGDTGIDKNIDDLSNTPADADVVTTSTGADFVITITFPANTGVWTVTVPKCTLNDGDAEGTTCLVSHSTPGVTNNVVTLIDDDAASSELLVRQVRKVSDGSGAATTLTTYHTFTHDSTDNFNLTGSSAAEKIPAATATQFATALAVHTGTPVIELSYRTGALTTGISFFKVTTS